MHALGVLCSVTTDEESAGYFPLIKATPRQDGVVEIRIPMTRSPRSRRARATPEVVGLA